MALIHCGTWDTLQAIDIADISNSDTAYIYYNERNHLMQFDSAATDAENNSTRPYHLRPHDYATAGVWVEQIGNEYDAYSGDQIKTGAIESLNWVGGTSGMKIDLDNELIAIKDDTFGNAGVQLGWISSAYKFYVGDGANQFLQFDGTKLTWKASNSELDSDGKLTATGASISGAITAATIDIGGSDATSFHVDTDGNMWLGAAAFNIATNPFAVSNAGVLRAVSGAIGGWTLGATSLTSTNIGLHSGASAEILLGHATTYASAKIGLKNDGSGKLAGGKIVWNTDGDVTIGDATRYIKYDGALTIDVDANVGTGVGVIYKGGLRWLYDFNPAHNGTVQPDGYNAFLGVECGNLTIGSTATTTGEASWNVGIGYRSLSDLTKGYANIGVGYYALHETTSGYHNVAIGACALDNNQTGNRNIAIGSDACSDTNADSNVAIGNATISFGSSGVGNTVIGSSAGAYCGNGSYNTILGYGGMLALEGGSYNVGIGYNAGRKQFNGLAGLETPEYSIYIGYQAYSGSDPFGGEDAIDNEIVIGKSTIGNGSNTVTLGNTSIGEFHCQVALTVDSDERIKRNISPALAGLAFINSLNPITFQMLNPADYPDDIKPCNFKDRIVKEKDPNTKKEIEKLIKADPRPQDNDKKYIGLAAQEVERVMQEQGINIDSLVVTSNRGKKAITYENLIMPLIRAIQELSGKIDMIEERINH